MLLPVDIGQGTNSTEVNPTNWNAIVNGVNNLKDYYSQGLVFDVTHADYGAKGDGVTDDLVAIQAALTAAGNAGGGIVFFPPGTYYYTSATAHCLVIPDNVTIAGCGNVSILKPKSVFGLSAYIASGTRSNIVIKDIKIAPHVDATYANAGISVYKATNVKISNVNISAYPSYAIHISLSNNVIVDKCELSCKVISTPTIVYITAGCYNIKINACKFGYGYYGVLVDGTVANPTYDISVTDNFYYGDSVNLADCAFMFVTVYCYRIVVKGNFIRNCLMAINSHNASEMIVSENDITIPATTLAYGMYIYGEIATRIENINISNNTIRRSDLLTLGIDIFLGRIDGLSVVGNICDVGKSSGIQLNNITSGTVVGNTVRTRESGYVGISMTAAPNIVVANNHVASTDVYGISLGTGGPGEVIASDNAIVSGNTITKTSGASNYGAIYIDAAVNCIVNANQYSSTYNYGEVYYINSGLSLSINGTPKFKNLSQRATTLPIAATVSFNMNNAGIFKVNLTSAAANIRATNGTLNQRSLIRIKDTATGGHLVTATVGFVCKNKVITGIASKSVYLEFLKVSTARWEEINRYSGV